jgi:hypothetical protein
VSQSQAPVCGRGEVPWDLTPPPLLGFSFSSTEVQGGVLCAHFSCISTGRIIPVLMITRMWQPRLLHPIRVYSSVLKVKQRNFWVKPNGSLCRIVEKDDQNKVSVHYHILRVCNVWKSLTYAKRPRPFAAKCRITEFLKKKKRISQMGKYVRAFAHTHTHEITTTRVVTVFSCAWS